MESVSIIMAVYNAEKYLTESIRSVLVQSYEDYEFIIVDDGSTDDSLSIIKKFAKENIKIKYFTIPHSGLAKALNFGCGKSINTYIARIDADDVWMPNKLETQIDFLRQHPEISLLGSSATCINQNGHSIYCKGFNHGKEMRHEEIVNKLLRYNVFCHSSVIFKRDVFEKAGKYDESFFSSMDYDLWIRIAKQHQTFILSNKLIQYRFSDDMMSKHYKKLQIKESVKIHHKAFSLFYDKIRPYQKILFLYDLLRLKFRSISFLQK